jgi:hypothetical protein
MGLPTSELVECVRAPHMHGMIRATAGTHSDCRLVRLPHSGGSVPVIKLAFRKLHGQGGRARVRTDAPQQAASFAHRNERFKAPSDAGMLPVSLLDVRIISVSSPVDEHDTP